MISGVDPLRRYILTSCATYDSDLNDTLDGSDKQAIRILDLTSGIWHIFKVNTNDSGAVVDLSVAGAPIEPSMIPIFHRMAGKSFSDRYTLQ